ncbi:tRNA glutamyl-Q(34) synthetase GluQRS [Deinococcus sp.]|uniref:tRNA glutamyl-Q(34) synthetase GluQRS n=1 Tax=Deinococcus sp. TaxID=47478 RepID=UPI0028699FDC|nr:tRNA glutamyl-Q(34) synthetase GluQRS [Deinococcus sp.]
MLEPQGEMVGRFAPSPTGAMHLGNARTALLAWLHSRSRGGRHFLRFEDLDSGRVRGWAYDVTRRDLEWLGLDWDAEYLQSRRLDVYADALSRLDTYPCTCTRREVLAAIEDSAGAPHGEEPVYPGTCAGVVTRHTRPAALRWRVPASTVCAHDALRDWRLCQFLPDDVGDVVVRRSDGVYAYHLAVVVDDALMGVTDVVRGEDLWTATPRQVALQVTLGYPPVEYRHMPLMKDFEGQRLAKRDGAPGVRELRDSGRPAGGVVSALARSLGWDVPEEITPRDLIPLWRVWDAREAGVPGTQT